MTADPFRLAGESFGSRLLLGTAGYPTQRILLDAAAASGCEIMTVSIRRISLKGHGFDTVNLLSKYRFLPNTAGCETARDAIKTAELAREALDTNWVKLELICRRAAVPVIVDAGIGTASDAVIAMELGASAVLLNTAVAKAEDPVRIAAAMRHAVEAGRHAYLAGRIPRRTRAEPSSPQLGLVGS